MRDRLDVIWFVAALLAAWELLYHAVGDAGLAPPGTTLITVGKLLVDGGFWHNASATGYAVLLAVIISVVGGPVTLFSGSRFAATSRPDAQRASDFRRSRSIR